MNGKPKGQKATGKTSGGVRFRLPRLVFSLHITGLVKRSGPANTEKDALQSHQ